MRATWTILRLSLACLFLSLSAGAQTGSTGALTGTVSDSTGAVIAGAQVKATNVATGEERTVVCQENGNYTVTLLLPGSYRVEFSATGFKQAVKPVLQVNVTETARLDVQLEVGNVQEQVTVTSEAGLLQTESSTLGTVANSRAVSNLPLVNRNMEHQRGTFPNADKIYDTALNVQIDTAGGIQQFPAGGAGTPGDPEAVGTDQTDGTVTTLRGNFGVLYRMHISTKSSDGRNFGFLINPRGGNWGGAVRTMPGLLPGGSFQTPNSSPYQTGDNTKGVIVGRYAPGASLTPWMQWMPCGGCNMPVRFISVPH
ncbi:hypothetical protein BH20ACI3_BH20ACI3_03200 [soil metagenome]